jgi:hypothetical protein
LAETTEPEPRDPSCWYPLDGTWHRSVAAKMSSLHLKYSANGGAMCNTSAALLEDDGYTESEAKSAGRTLCKRCLKSVGRKE